jgi:hypothetical protein
MIEEHIKMTTENTKSVFCRVRPRLCSLASSLCRVVLRMRAVCKAPTLCAVFVPTGSLLAPLCFLQNFARLELKTSGSMKTCEEITRARVLHRACDRARRHAARQRRGVRSALVVAVPEPPRLRASCLATSDSVPEVPSPTAVNWLVGAHRTKAPSVFDDAPGL